MGHFEIFMGTDEQFYFHLKTANGEIVASSQGYTTKQSAVTGIDALKDTAPLAAVLDLTLAPETAQQNQGVKTCQ